MQPWYAESSSDWSKWPYNWRDQEWRESEANGQSDDIGNESESCYESELSFSDWSNWPYNWRDQDWRDHDWRNQEWLGLQRLWNSAFGESRTNTRVVRGGVHRRWEEGLEYIISH